MGGRLQVSPTFLRIITVRDFRPLASGFLYSIPDHSLDPKFFQADLRRRLSPGVEAGLDYSETDISLQTFREMCLVLG